MAENPSDMATLADYAWADARKAREENASQVERIVALEHAVEFLSQSLVRLIGQVDRLVTLLDKKFEKDAQRQSTF